MENFLEKLKNAGKINFFEASRKKTMRNRLLGFMSADASIREDEVSRSVLQGVHTIFASSLKPMPIIAFIAIATLVSGGTSFAAQNSLPGDFLYPVKVNVNEKIVAALQISSEAKAAYEAQLAERRLEEAGELASKQKLNTESKTEVQNRFADHADKARGRIGALQAEGKVQIAADLASRFEGVLKAHEHVLNNLESKNESEKDNIESINVGVRAKLDEMGDLRMRLETKAGEDIKSENKVNAKASAEGKVRAATNVIASVRSSLETNRVKLGANAAARAEARLKMSDDLILQANAKIAAEAHAQAFNLANKAIRIAQESRTLIKARAEFGGDVDTNSNDINSLENDSALESEHASSTRSEGEMEGASKTKVRFGF